MGNMIKNFLGQLGQEVIFFLTICILLNMFFFMFDGRLLRYFGCLPTGILLDL